MILAEEALRLSDELQEDYNGLRLKDNNSFISSIIDSMIKYEMSCGKTSVSVNVREFPVLGDIVEYAKDIVWSMMYIGYKVSFNQGKLIIEWGE